MSWIKVTLDHPQNSYTAGQKVTGAVQCFFDKEKKLSTIEVKFKGKAETKWTERVSHYNSSTKRTEYRTVVYHASELYFNAIIVLYRESGSKHPPGSHSYRFAFDLPRQTPSSFEGSRGKIRYTVKGVGRRSWKFDYKNKIPISVTSLLDLNTLSNLREPVFMSLDQTFCTCWCGRSGPVTFNLSLPASGFVAGQDISIGNHISNMSSVNIEQIRYKMIKTLKFIAKRPSTKKKVEKTVLVSGTETGVGAHGAKSWTTTIRVPAQKTYPNLLPCQIITITYCLEVAALVPMPHSNLEFKIPITIGHVPLQGVNTSFTAGPPPT